MPAMSKMVNTAAVLLAALASQANAHTYVKVFEAGGKTYQGFYAENKSGGDDSSPAWRTNQGWGFQPVMGDQINTPHIIAHIDAEPSPFTAPVPAGSTVKFTWQHDGECGGQEVGWDCSHHGWTTTYLAPCNGDCSQVKKEELSFFKIHEVGLLDYREGHYNNGDDTGYWGTDTIFYGGGNTESVNIPKDLPNGNYVMRTEVTSVHNNGPVSQRQLWPQAFNIAITGGNDNAPMPAGVKGTEIYSSSDELLNYDLYDHPKGKTFANAPGPALAPCAGGPGGSAPGGGDSPAPSTPTPTGESGPATPSSGGSYDQPGATPPADSPPADSPPSDAPPADSPPADSPVDYSPPFDGDSPDNTFPASPNPPPTYPPTNSPPANSPPANSPPADSSPADSPPAVQPSGSFPTVPPPAASSPAGYSTSSPPKGNTNTAPTVPAVVPGQNQNATETAYQTGGHGEHNEHEDSDDEGSDDDYEGGWSDDEEEDDEDSDNEEEETPKYGGKYGWGPGRENWRSHARSFSA